MTLLIGNIKKAEQLVDRMALVEHMNEVHRVQNGKTFHLGTIIFSARHGTDLLIVERHRDKIHQWLSPPDHSSMHNAISEKRHEQTGIWFIQDEHYVGWKTDLKSFIWLYGTRMLLCHLFDCFF